MKKGKTYEEKAEAYQHEIESISANLLKQIEHAEGNWELPWHKGLPIAQNIFTGKQYGGNNLLILWNRCLQYNYPRNHWATLYQWRKVKANVKKGEKGTLICIAIPKIKQDNSGQLKLEELIAPKDISNKATHFRFIFKYLFNEAQVLGYYGNQPGLFDSPLSGEALMQQLIERSKAKIKTGGDRACYSMIKDEIRMPEMARFIATPTSTMIENYYSTIIHELIHWTGHEKRCNRKSLYSYGEFEYAFEELVAELGAALLCTQINQKPSPAADHAQYIKSWFRVLKQDFSYFTESLELARTAIYFLNDMTGIYPFLKPQFQRKIKIERIEEWAKISNIIKP